MRDTIEPRTCRELIVVVVREQCNGRSVTVVFVVVVVVVVVKCVATVASGKSIRD